MAAERVKVFFPVPSLVQGGAERQVLELIARLPARFEPVLALWRDEIHYRQQLPAGQPRYVLGTRRMTRPPYGSPTLVLVPTALEERGIQDAGGLEIGSALRATCGFGPIAAAARTARLVAELAPSRVFLVGIAGTYDPERTPIGTALEFGAVAIDGVGAGLGERSISSAALGFGSADRLELGGGDPRDLLLTTCSASGTPADARLRRERFPTAACEDMEGFAVAEVALGRWWRRRIAAAFAFPGTER